jgi:uncharacterized lipoprotein YmbA
MLTPVTTGTAHETRTHDLAIGIGPVSLPKYLDRQGIVSRSSDHQLDVPVYHQWAEPLQENFGRVVMDNMAVMLSTDRVLMLPVRRSLRQAVVFDYQVTIGVNQFEKTATGDVVLDARWAILDNDKNELLLRRSVYTDTPAAADYAAQVSAQSKVLGQYCEEIAAEIRRLAEQRP